MRSFFEFFINQFSLLLIKNTVRKKVSGKRVKGEEVEEFNTSITIPIFTTDQPDNLLHPNHALARSNRSTPSSISSAGEFDTEFDLTLMVKPIEQPKDQRGRTSHVNLLPPAPIFTASVTYDGWEENGEELDDEEQILSNEVFFVNDDNLQVSYPRKLSAYSSGGESEYEGNVEVGCTLSLVDKAALQDSGSEYTTDSDYEDESESYEESEEFEEEYSEEDISEEANIDMNKVTVELNGITTITDNNSNIIDEKLTTILIEPKLEDKSAVRKAPENMSVDEQKRVEQKQKELADQKARSTGLVNSMRNQFRPPSPIKQEPITYKRSTRLEPKPLDEQRERKNYTVVKPVINDEFDKQMAELRAQMEDKNTRLLTDYRNLSKGINSTSDDAKLRAKEDQHRELIDKSTNAFRQELKQVTKIKAEEERARWHEQNMSSVERKHREDEERERKRQLELKALADEVAAVFWPPVCCAASVYWAKNQMQKCNDNIKIGLFPDFSKAAAQLAAQAAERKVTKRVMRKPADIKQETNVTSAVKKAEPIKQTIDRLNKKSATPEKKILAPTENTLVPPTQTQANGERRKSIPSSRRKTMELMVRTLDGGEKDENANVKVKKSRKRKHQIYRKNKFVRKPFDIDDLLGFSAFKDFEELDNYFRDSSSGMRKPVAKLDDQKRRRMEPQKIWISQLKDIDKLYKSSELRDIKLDGVS
ncbi:hypothetical protein M3Y97_00448600 [Aphelenchoides bicaudatus]|nr:hypothetical protein M3Y97_00448600 [Aphelenchoides bicaudatus]